MKKLAEETVALSPAWGLSAFDELPHSEKQKKLSRARSMLAKFDVGRKGGNDRREVVLGGGRRRSG